MVKALPVSLTCCLKLFFESEPVILNPLFIFIFHARILRLWGEAKPLNEEGKKVICEQRRRDRA